MGRYQKLEQRMKALTSERRLQILAYLKKNHTATVSDIARALNLSIYGTSQHLRALRSAGAVTYVRRGKYVSYRLSLKQEEPIKAVMKLL